MNKGHKSLHFLKSWVGLTFSLQFTWDSLCPCIYHFLKIIGEFHTGIYVLENFIHTYMYFDQVHPLIPYIQFLPAPAFPFRCICLELPVCAWVWDYPLEHGQPLGGCILSLSQQPSVPRSSSAGVGLHLLLPKSVPGILTGLVQVLSGAMSSCMQHCDVQQILLWYRHPFPLALQSILDFFQEEPWALKEGLCTLTGWKSLHCKKMLLWEGWQMHWSMSTDRTGAVYYCLAEW